MSNVLLEVMNKSGIDSLLSSECTEIKKKQKQLGINVDLAVVAASKDDSIGAEDTQQLTALPVYFR